jgi:hypothetical protein
MIGIDSGECADSSDYAIWLRVNCAILRPARQSRGLGNRVRKAVSFVGSADGGAVNSAVSTRTEMSLGNSTENPCHVLLSHPVECRGRQWHSINDRSSKPSCANRNMLDGAIGKSLGRCGYPGQKSANSAQVKTGLGLIIKQILGSMGTDRTEGEIHAHHGICTRERAGSVLHGSGFGREQALGTISKPGSRPLPGFCRMRGRVMLPQRQPENSEAQDEALNALRRTGLSAGCAPYYAPWRPRLRPL